jgi:flavin-dependent dehydrogenase
MLYKAKRIDNGEWIEGQLSSDNKGYYWIIPSQDNPDSILTAVQVYYQTVTEVEE